MKKKKNQKKLQEVVLLANLCEPNTMETVMRNFCVACLLHKYKIKLLSRNNIFFESVQIKAPITQDSTNGPFPT